MDGRIYFTSDISQLPRVVDCPSRSNPSTAAPLSNWPEHVLLFVTGQPLEDDVSVSLVSGSVTEDIGVLSRENLFLHRATGGDSTPAALRDVGDRDVRLTTTFVPRGGRDTVVRGAAARVDVPQRTGGSALMAGAVTASGAERPSTPVASMPSASQAAGDCSQETGYGAERSSSAAPTPALCAMPPSSPARNSLDASGGVPSTVVAISGVAVGAGLAVIAPPEFDEEDSDDGEMPWPSSQALDLDLDHLSPVPGGGDALDQGREQLPVLAVTSSSGGAPEQDQDLLGRISPVPVSSAELDPNEPSHVAVGGGVDSPSGASLARAGSTALDPDRTSPSPARARSDSPMDQDAGRLSPTPTNADARDPARLSPVPRVAACTEPTPMDDEGLQCTPGSVHDRSESSTPASAASSTRGRKRTKASRWSSSKRRKQAPNASPNRNSSGEPCMSGRWGHAACLLDDNNVLILGGEGTYKRMSKDSLLRVTIGESTSASYTEVVCAGTSCPERRTGHSAVLDPDDKVLYMYGGSKGTKWFSDVQALDVTTCQWQKLEMKGVAPSRAYHTCSFFRKEGLVFGGIFPEPDPEPDGSSNDLYIFSLSEQNWYKPVVTGDLPCPRSGHSAARLGHHLFILGGWDYPSFFDDLFVLDLELMDFKKAAVTGTGPCARTWHSMTVLPDRRLLVYGGYSGDVALNDAFILDTENMAWSSVRSDAPLVMLPARVGHSVTASPEAEDGSSQLLVCGGGDNDGKFFSDLIVIKCDDL